MMLGSEVAVLVHREHREVDHPEELEVVVAGGPAQIEPQGPEHRPRVTLVRSADHEEQVARARRRAPLSPLASSSGARCLATGERSDPSASTTIHTRPLAPSSRARSTRASSTDREVSRAPALMPATMPPAASTPANAWNPVPANSLAEVDEFHAESGVGLVGCRSGASPRCQVIRGKGRRQLDAPQLAGHRDDHRLEGGEHVLAVPERALRCRAG